MTLTKKKLWLLLAPPVVVILLTGVAWIFLLWLSGEFSWMIPVGDAAVPANSEMVMKPHMQITTTSPGYELTITSGAGLKRNFTWAGATRSIELIPRTERWYGSLGGYFPGPDKHWRSHDGVFRCVADEGQLNFSAVGKAMKWLTLQTGGCYRNDGLFLRVDKSNTLSIDLFQIYIQGKKPTSLPGAHDAKISVVAEYPIAATTAAPVDALELNDDESKVAEKIAADSFYSSFFDMAETFFKEHQYENAIDCYDQALTSKKSTYIYKQRAICFLKMDRLDKAQDSCRLGLQLSPNHASLLAVKNEIATAKKSSNTTGSEQQ